MIASIFTPISTVLISNIRGEFRKHCQNKLENSLLTKSHVTEILSVDVLIIYCVIIAVGMRQVPVERTNVTLNGDYHACMYV